MARLAELLLEGLRARQLLVQRWEPRQEWVLGQRN